MQKLPYHTSDIAFTILNHQSTFINLKQKHL